MLFYKANPLPPRTSRIWLKPLNKVDAKVINLQSVCQADGWASEEDLAKSQILEFPLTMLSMTSSHIYTTMAKIEIKKILNPVMTWYYGEDVNPWMVFVLDPKTNIWYGEQRMGNYPGGTPYLVKVSLEIKLINAGENVIIRMIQDYGDAGVAGQYVQQLIYL